jgi:hypothetical protein
MPGRSAIERSFFFTVTRRVRIPAATEGGAATYDIRTISGYCFCNALVASSFLDIPDTVGLSPTTEQSSLSVAASTRTLEVLGGGTGTTSVQEHTRSRGFAGRQGSKTAIMQTGRPTRAGGRRKSTISFRFPSWCKAADISDVLGEIIPPTKISSTPGATEVRNQFQLRGGKRYPITPQAAAEATASPSVPASQAESEAAGQASTQGRGKT